MDAEYKIVEVNHEIDLMKYDDNIRHRHIYQNLLHEKADALQEPRELPKLLPRRKRLDDPDLPGDKALEFKLPGQKVDLKSGYYDTSVDPLYNIPALGHDVYNTNIGKQKK